MAFHLHLIDHILTGFLKTRKIFYIYVKIYENRIKYWEYWKTQVNKTWRHEENIENKVQLKTSQYKQQVPGVGKTRD